MKKREMIIQMDDRAATRVDELTKRRGEDLSTTLRVALHLLDVATSCVEAGGTVLLVDKDGKPSAVVLGKEKA